MNEESQNAFLKTLEEPPPKTWIVLVTSAPDRLLTTIRSRCQRFGFNLLKEKELKLFWAKHSEGLSDFPLRLAEGSPGRLLILIKADAAVPRNLLMDFIASKVLPSPVKATHELIEWANQKGNLRQQLREYLRLSLHLATGLLRDIAVLLEGAQGRHLLNQDLEKPLKEATLLYDLPGLFYAIQQIVENTADITGYVDPGLAVENTFRIIREVRKRG
jgi:hypothetical protein